MRPLPNYKRLRLRHVLPLLLLIPLLAAAPIARAQGLIKQLPPPPAYGAEAAMHKGIENFKNGEYDAAIENFTIAKRLDPQLLNARLYLATTYATQYIPGASSESNKNNALAAIKEYKELLSLDPENLSAIDGLGSLIFQMAGTPFDPAMFVESKSYHLKHIQLRPEDPEPYYWVGVIDWTLSFRANADLRSDYNQAHPRRPVLDTDPMPRDLREVYRRNFGAIILEGVDHLQKAIQRRPDYDDAMAYLNLLYRRQADLAETQNEREDLLQRADELIDQIKVIKQRKSAAEN